MVIGGSSVVNTNRGESLRASMLGHSRVSDYMRAKHGNKFVVDDPGQKPVEFEKQV
jgi:hypothetical protein